MHLARSALHPYGFAMGRLSFLCDLWAFLRIRKKWWLLPLLIIILLLGALIILGQNPVLGPFIYTVV
jgi:hypothetical protein